MKLKILLKAVSFKNILGNYNISRKYIFFIKDDTCDSILEVRNEIILGDRFKKPIYNPTKVFEDRYGGIYSFDFDIINEDLYENKKNYLEIKLNKDRVLDILRSCYTFSTYFSLSISVYLKYLNTDTSNNSISSDTNIIKLKKLIDKIEQHKIIEDL